MDIKNNINTLQERIQDILRTVGRQREEVTIIGVTKTVDQDTLQQAVLHGLTDFGENRVQELLAKYNPSESIRWHMIGRLQRNKVKYLIDKVAMIHSLDSLPLAREINRQAEKIQKVVPVLIQVNPANEETKAGIPYEEVFPFIESIFNLGYIKVMGLMLIAPQAGDTEAIRPYFTMMKQLFDDLKRVDYPHIDMRYLSMGMTNDYETAIEEGSNMVRIGTAIFGKRKKEEGTCLANL